MKDEAKRKEAKFSKNMARLICVAVMILTMGMMAGCGKGEESESDNTASETSEAIEEVEEENASEAVENAETLEPTETGETIEETEEQDTPAESDAPQNIEEWVNTVVSDEVIICIWDDTTKEGAILENNQEYIVERGEQLVICGNSLYSISVPESFESGAYGTGYVIEEFTDVFLEPTSVDISVGTMEREVYTFHFTFIYGTEETENTDTNVLSFEDGEQWVMSLNYTEPKLVFWNDAIGTRTVVENGENYQMSDGDVMAVYLPEGCYLSGVEVDYENMNFVSEEGYSIIDYSTLEQKATVELELTMVAATGDFIFPVYTITTP